MGKAPPSTAVGRTIWDFASEGHARWLLILLLAVPLAYLLISGGTVLFRGQPLIQFGTGSSGLHLERWEPAIKDGVTFKAEEDGFIYLSCGENHECCVYLQDDAQRQMTTGLVKEFQSGMFPILKGQVAVVTQTNGTDPYQIYAYFVGFRK